MYMWWYTLCKQHHAFNHNLQVKKKRKIYELSIVRKWQTDVKIKKKNKQSVQNANNTLRQKKGLIQWKLQFIEIKIGLLIFATLLYLL